jgi:integrase
MEMIYSRELGISVVSDKPPSGASNDICIKDALVLYQRLKGAGKTKLFFEGSERSIRYLIECVGHDNINGLEPADAGRFRDFLFDRGMSSSSVKRVFSSVRAIMNLTIKEHGLAMTNVFNGTFIPEDNKSKERLPVPNDVIRRIQGECRSHNDEPRWLIALISDTGMRLSEACGLLSSDIVLDTDIPHISLTEHPWRRLKTSSSTRSIPLVGASLWAAKEIKAQETEFAFPKYCNTQKCNANSASAALNKWLKPRLPEGCVIHSFRHSLRDRLRAVECPSDIVDAIGGWTTEGIGQRYGKGYDLNVKAKWMKEMVY